MSTPAAAISPATGVVVAHGSVAGRLALRMLVEVEAGFKVAGEADHAGRAGQLARDRHAGFLLLHGALLAHSLPGPLPLSCRLVILGLDAPAGDWIRSLGPDGADYVRWDRTAEDLPAILRRARGQLAVVPEP